MTKPNTNARARVTVTMEVDVSDSWGPDCSIAQVHRQASEAAIGMIRNSLVREHPQRVRILDAVPTAILTEPKKG